MSKNLLLLAITVGILALFPIAPVSGVTIIRETVPASPTLVRREITVIREPAPPAAKTAPPVALNSYEYYPDRGVYFNPTSRIWYWEENGDWHSGKILPSRFLPLSPKVRLKIRSETPNIYHERHLAPKAAKPEVPPKAGNTRIIETKIIESDPRPFEFTYYPEAGVYYDPRANQYLWKEGGEWKLSRHQPSTVLIDPAQGEPVVLKRTIVVGSQP